MASDKQTALVKKLLAERVVPDAILTLVNAKLAEDMTPGQFSKTGVIDILFNLPKANAKAVPALAPGIYLHNGVVYQVVEGKSGNMYAKVLDSTDKQRFAYATGKFVYVGGAIFDLPADAQPVTIDQALAFGLAHGMCVKGHPLTDPLSIKLGIGPKCCETMFGMTQAQLAKQRAAAASGDKVPALF